MSNYEDHWMDGALVAEQSVARTGRTAARSTAAIIKAYQDGRSMTDAEVEQVYHALARLHNAVLEVGNDVCLVIPWLVPKLHSFEGFMKYRAEKREAARREAIERIETERKRIAAINERLHPEMFKDPDAGWGPWLLRRDGAFPFQKWCPFENNDYVQASCRSSHSDNEPILRDYVKNLWWGWSQDDAEEGGVIRRARKWVGPGKPPGVE